MVDQNKSIRVLYYSKNIGVPTLTFIFNEIEKLQSSPKFIIKVVSENYVNRKKFIVKNISLINPIKRSYFFNKIWWFLYFNNIRLNYYDKVYNSKLNDIIDDFKPDIIHSQA